jgi:hypothetical protein
MPQPDSPEFNQSPSFVKPTHVYGQTFGDEFHAEAVAELLLSTAGYTQRGVTLLGGQGQLPTGCILARHTASGKYLAYRPSATDGCQTALGVLRDARDTGGLGYASIAALGTGVGVTLSGGAQVFPASPSGALPQDCLGNLVIRGILNASLVSGQDSASLVSGTGGGVGTPTLTALGARVLQLGGGTSSAGLPGAGPFPGGPMDGQALAAAGVVTLGVNAFIF